MNLTKEEAIQFWKEKIETTSFFEAQKDFITLFENLPKIIKRDNSNLNNIEYFRFGSRSYFWGEKIAGVERHVDFMDFSTIYYKIHLYNSFASDEIFNFSKFDTVEVAIKRLEEYLENKGYENESRTL
jgi:hypothetical protein